MNNHLKPIRFGWLLWSDGRKASTRINGLNIHHELRRKGYGSIILPNPDISGRSSEVLFSALLKHDISIVVLHKYLHGCATQLAEFCCNRGIKTVYLACDPVDWTMGLNTVDGVIAVTRVLLDKIPFPRAIPAMVLPDAHETPLDFVKSDYRQLSRKLTLGTISTRRLQYIPFSLRKNEHIEVIGSRTLLDRTAIFGSGLFTSLYRMKYRVKKSNIPFPVTKQWSIDSILSNMINFDVGILPESDESFQYKSNNRLTQMMSLGLPVVSSPLPAYQSIVKHGINGFLAETPSDWRNAVETLKDPDIRRLIGQKAREDTFENFSIRTISEKFIKFCEGLTN